VKGLLLVGEGAVSGAEAGDFGRGGGGHFSKVLGGWGEGMRAWIIAFCNSFWKFFWGTDEWAYP
jgi:hypothetical protein